MLGGGKVMGGAMGNRHLKAQMKENRAPSTTWRGTQIQVTHQARLFIRRGRVEKVEKEKVKEMGSSLKLCGDSFDPGLDLGPAGLCHAGTLEKVPPPYGLRAIYMETGI